MSLIHTGLGIFFQIFIFILCLIHIVICSPCLPCLPSNGVGRVLWVAFSYLSLGAKPTSTGISWIIFSKSSTQCDACFDIFLYYLSPPSSHCTRLEAGIPHSQGGRGGGAAQGSQQQRYTVSITKNLSL